MTGTDLRKLAALLLALLVIGCASEEEMAATRGALDQLETELLDDHTELTEVTATWDVSTGVDRVEAISVRGRAELTDATGPELVERIAQDTWRSDIPAISTITVDVIDVDDPDARHSTSDVFDSYVTGRDELETRFGSRDG